MEVGRVRRFQDKTKTTLKLVLFFTELDEAALSKIALVAHDLYASIDLVSLALKTLDDRDSGNRFERYLAAVMEQAAP